MYLSIDPGRCTGWASFNARGELQGCGISEERVDGSGRKLPPNPQTVLIELPQIYRGRFMKGDPNDLVPLALQCGELRERYTSHGAPVVLVKPHEWKGTIDKKTHHDRMLRWMSEELHGFTRLDLNVINEAVKSIAASKVNNMMDAVGLGRWGLQRRMFKIPTGTTRATP